MMVFWIFLAVFAVLILWVILIYNRLVTLRNDVKNAWSQIDVQLKRRYDLIPNLVAAVQGFMEHEKEVFDKVALARTQAMTSKRLNDKASAENHLSETVKSLFMVMENYPVLKSNVNVMHLQEELVSTENRIAFSRQLYNDLVANYITRTEVFPDVIIASSFSFQPFEYFRAEKSDKEVPKAAL